MRWPVLSDTHLREIDELEAAVGHGRYSGWCWEPDGTVCVDVLGQDDKPIRYRGATLRQALRIAKENAPC